VKIRVLTLNIYSPGNPDWERRRPALHAGIRALDPDLVALQEVVDPVDLLGPDYALAPHSGRSDDGVGAVLASRWPIEAVHEQDLHVTGRTKAFPWAAAVAAEIASPLGRLLFVHHKPSYQLGWSLERERQAVAAARLAEELAGRADHVILAGDLDDTPDSASIRFWTGKQSLDGLSVRYEDTWYAAHGDAPGLTFDPRNPLVPSGTMPLDRGRRIDYVMVRCGTHGPTLDVAACELALAEPTADGVWPSDHFGVVADLVRPARAPESE
jgi:endonuclease/exonuclease/phosphatase family metal-dependent hydrolase